MKARGIAIETLRRQIRAAISWPAVIRRKYLSTVRISDDDITKALEQYKASLSKPRHRAAEIFLPVENPSDDARVRANAKKILDELKAGASFSLLATQFSQSASAARGGDLGWVRPGQVPPEVEDVLAKLPLNSVSTPVRTATGYYILQLQDRRAAGDVISRDATVVLQQIILPVPARAPASEWDSQMALARTIKETASGCADFKTIALELGSKLSGDLGRLKVKELPAQSQRMVTSLPIGVASEPERVAQGLRVIMVCNRTSEVSKLPDRNRIRRILQTRRLEARARRHLRDLRQSAFIEVRRPR